MANILTTVRIICAPLILIFPAFSTQFYVFYLLGGITDAIDGTVARKLGKATAWGAKYDSAADILFALAALIRIINRFGGFPVMAAALDRHDRIHKSRKYDRRLSPISSVHRSAFRVE